VIVGPVLLLITAQFHARQTTVNGWGSTILAVMLLGVDRGIVLAAARSVLDRLQ
jgi:hypothetical protein